MLINYILFTVPIVGVGAIAAYLHGFSIAFALSVPFAISVFFVALLEHLPKKFERMIFRIRRLYLATCIIFISYQLLKSASGWEIPIVIAKTIGLLVAGTIGAAIGIILISAVALALIHTGYYIGQKLGLIAPTPPPTPPIEPKND